MKRFILTLIGNLTILNFYFSSAQAPEWVWAKSAGGPSYHEVTGTTVDAIGNVYVTGYFRGSTILFGSRMLTNANLITATEDIFVVKYDSSGNVLWAQRAGGEDDDYGKSITTDADGNLYLTGFFYSDSIIFGNTILVDTSTSASDIFMAKYDPSGNVLWAKNLRDAIAGNVATDIYGNAYVSGQLYSDTLIFGSSVLINSPVPNSDILIAKYDSSGNELWARNARGFNWDMSSDITTDILGNVYITGSFLSDSVSFGNTVLFNADSVSRDFFIAKYDQSGNDLWAIRAGGTNDEEGFGIITDSGGSNIYATGYFASDSIVFGSFVLHNAGSAGYSDMFIVKYDSSGNALWAKRAGGTSFEIGWDIVADDSGNVYVTGSFPYAPLFFDSVSLTHSGLFVVKYNSAGNAIWAQDAVGISLGKSICMDDNGNLIVAGVFLSNKITFGNTVLNINFSGYHDMFVAKLSYFNYCNAYYTIYPDTIPHNWILVNQASGAPPLTYSWDWGDGTPSSTGPTPSHIYSTAGNYNICVSIVDSLGCSSSYCDSSTYLYRGTSSSTMVSVNVVTPVGMNEPVATEILFSIYPNPANGQFTIASSISMDEVKITNIFGAMVHLSNPHENNISLELKESGIYFIQIKSGIHIAVKRLIVSGE